MALLLMLGLCSCTSGGAAEQPIGESGEPTLGESAEPESKLINDGGFLNALPFPEGPEERPNSHYNGLSEKAQEKYRLNNDTIGWVEAPGTGISEQVMFYPDKNDKFYYLRKDFNEEYSFEGSYFADYRSSFEGGREGLSWNTIIYGHSMEDNPDGPLFSQLKKYRDPDFARENPYIYFSTLDEDMAWEVFAIFVSTTTLPYNQPDPSPELPPVKDKNTGEIRYLQDMDSILEEVRGRSIYHYNIEVGEEDRILTLSTCIYQAEGRSLSYPNNYRYVVMAKLVPAEEELKETTTFVENDDIWAP